MTTPQDPFSTPRNEGDRPNADSEPPAGGSEHGSPEHAAPQHGTDPGTGYDQPGQNQPGQNQPGQDQPGYGQQTASPAYGQPAYGAQPGYAGGQTGAPKNGLGIAALILGILALVTSISVVGGIVLGLLAIILGFIGRGRAKRGEATNGGMALAGIILGIISMLISIFVIVAGVSLFNSSGGKDLVDCINNAAGDSAAEAACQQQFQDDLSN